MKTPDNKISSCCKAPIIYHTEDEGTGYMSCEKCGKACDWYSEPTKHKAVKCCTGLNCPERRSLCCGAVCGNGDMTTEPHFVCSKCRKEYRGGECTAGNDRCGYMILTPTPEHGGGMWCAEEKPCKRHPEQPKGECTCPPKGTANIMGENCHVHWPDNPTPPSSKEWEVPLMEKLAAIEHERWADWQKYFFEQCIPQNNDGKYVDLTLPIPKYERWNRQIKTPYSELSESEKESDRREVCRYFPLISQVYTEGYEAGKKEEKIRMNEESEESYNIGLQFALDFISEGEGWEETKEVYAEKLGLTKHNK